MSDWHKSTYSNDGPHCVEAREHAHGVDVRDTVHREAGALTFGACEWTALLKAETSR